MPLRLFVLEKPSTKHYATRSAALGVRAFMSAQNIFLVVSFIVSTLFLMLFFSIDSCLDAGGSASRFGFSCYGVANDFVPQYQRTAPLFWLLVFTIGGLIAFITKKVIASAKP